MRLVLLVTLVVLAVAACDSSPNENVTKPVDDQCPAGPADGESDFFPLKADEVWAFEYSSTWWDIHSPTTSEHGTLTLTLDEPTCADGTRTVAATENRRGVRIRTYLRVDETREPDTLSFDETSDVTFVEAADGVQLPWTDGSIARYYGDSEDSIRAEAGPYWPVCGPGAAIATLTIDGLVAFSASCNHAGGGQSLQMVRSGDGT